MPRAVTILATVATVLFTAALVIPARGATTLSVLGAVLAGDLVEPGHSDACLVPGARPAAVAAASAVNGRRLFLRENCYICHGGRGGGGMCPNLREIGNSGNDEDLIRTIRNGTPSGMPAFGSRLSAAEIRDLVAYIRSLRSGAEPTFTIWWR